MTPAQRTAALKEESLRLGFDLAGVAPATCLPDFERLAAWLNLGCQGEMGYFADRLDAYRHPSGVLPGAKSVLMLGVNYRTVEPVARAAGQGAISRYAWGDDYHDWARRRLHALADFHRRLSPGVEDRGVVDTAPIFEKAFAYRAGLGWIGKNSLLINPRFGSWLFLAGLLTTDVLEYDKPLEGDCCGTCRLCLDACPNGALVAPRQLDARRCVSYLLARRQGDIPEELRDSCRGRLWGCDICQEACPWNQQTPVTPNAAFAPREGMNPVDIAEIESLDEAEFRGRFRGTPLWQIKREGILQNAKIAKLDNEDV